MSDEQPSVAVYAEPNVIKVSARTAGILLVFTLVFTALMAGMHSATESRLQASAQIQKLRMISEVLPAATYDNDLLQDSITLPATAALSTDSDTTIYRARKGGAPSALVLESVAPDGYSGRINLILAIGVDGRLIGLRVTQHRETPGLGDYIDPKKDRNKTRPWITQFNGQGFAQISPERWRVKKDGGVIDQMAGATISARAVTNASRRALEWATIQRTALFAQGAGTRYVSAPESEVEQ